MSAEKLDFVQLNYAIDDRAAEKRLLPLAADRGIAILVNQPFGGGGCCAHWPVDPCQTGRPTSIAEAGRRFCSNMCSATPP